MPTIRGTGSLFLQNLLSPPYERVSLRGERKPYSLVFNHLYALHMQHFYKWIQIFDLIITPIRRPELVAATWARRGDKEDHFWIQWDNWQKMVDLGALVLPIDHPDRDSYLEKISTAIDMKLETDWAPFNTAKAPRGTSLPVKVDRLYDIPIIGELYG